MKKLKLVALTLAMLTVVGLAGCTQQTPTNEATQTQTLPKKDRAGKDIHLSEKTTKIVSLAPSMTQVITDIGREADLVGVDMQSADADATFKKLPQFDMMAIDAEQLIALEPQVVYVTDINMASSESVWNQVEEAGIPIVTIPTSTTIGDIALDVQFIADSLDEHDKGKELVDTMNQEIATIREIGKTIQEKKKVLFEISALPDIYSFGQGTFLNEMLEVIGAENVLAGENGWLPVTEEAAIASNPDVILTSVDYIENPVEEVLARQNWSNVTAIQNQAVYEIDTDTSSVPNHHITKALKQMAKAVYPEAYQDVTND
uniref:ABC transporter substrate-binding protein n=1 Tax=Candidatus Enterococcus willemsii TaxID=1857215 RepID=UPI00403F2845